MSEVRLVVREPARDWSGTVHGSLADCAIAALSADPVSLAELETACARFAKPIADRPSNTNADNPKNDDRNGAFDDTDTAQGNADHAEQRLTSAHGRLQQLPRHRCWFLRRLSLKIA
jgi:hypothetical protein